jgi:hypothetical protein
MDKIYTYLENEKMIDAMEPTISQMTGMSAKEAFGMLTGELAGTVNGVEMKDVTRMNWITGEEMTVKEPTPDYALVIGIKDKTKSAKLIAKLSESMMLVKKDNYYSIMDKAFMVDKGSYLVITGTETGRQNSITGTKEKLQAGLNEKLTQNSTVFHFNLTQVPDGLWDNFGQAVKDMVKGTEIESVTMTSNSMVNNVAKGQFVMEFTNKEENTILTLGRLSKKFQEEMKSLTSSYQTGTEVTTDSTAVEDEAGLDVDATDEEETQEDN